MSETRPTGITANRQTGHLAVTWNDGHHSLYPFYLLRYACPCAECRGGHENMGSDPDPEWFTRPQKIHLPHTCAMSKPLEPTPSP
jgi:hypothetical protein